ncbi:MAG: hypothetical protein IH950_15080 [Bacteroidetes bacterium]|nr:hypothetical protein [Bacteroidota bacterium]
MKITTTFLQSLFIIFLLIISVRGQTAGDFQTYQTGNWNDVNTWERYNGTSWVNPAPSTPTSSDGVITIQNSHTVTVSVGVTIDQSTVNSGATLTINNGVTLTLYNGTDTDLTINGTTNNNGTLSRNSNSSVLINGSFINSGSFSGSSTKVTFASGSLYQHIQDGVPS